ncbi:hydrolase [Escherichia coli]
MSLLDEKRGLLYWKFSLTIRAHECGLYACLLYAKLLNAYCLRSQKLTIVIPLNTLVTIVRYAPTARLQRREQADLDANKTALVVIDLQEGILPFAGGPHTATDVVERASRLAQKCLARLCTGYHGSRGLVSHFAEALKQPVDSPAPAKALPDNWWNYPSTLGKRDSDIEVTKRQWGAFYGTDFEMQLRRRGIDTIILCGISTNIGVESTARNAWELGFNLIIAEDACSASSAEQHQSSMTHIFPRIARVRSTDEILAQRYDLSRAAAMVASQMGATGDHRP